jgi:hypothetical protein
VDRGRPDRQDRVGDDLPRDRARRRGRQEPAGSTVRSRSRPASTVLRYESDGSHSFGSVERESAGRPRHVGDYRFTG